VSPKLVTLERWVADTFGDAVTMETARRWVRAGKILPAPQKIGARYFLHPDARYTARSDKPRLIDRLRAEATSAA
jgi:predicted site-specific integrase-resolvase